MKVSYDKDYSIVVCARDPDERSMARCLTAVAALDTNGMRTEVLLVDDNSKAAVEDLPCVKNYTRRHAARHLHIGPRDPQPARMAAALEADGKYTVYIDADTAPAPGYLQALKSLHGRFPQVGAWGAGDVMVDFMDGIDRKIEGYARTAFLERHSEAMDFSTERDWQPCYPAGGGLCAYSSLLQEYAELAEREAFTSPRTSPLQLVTQAVLFCIRSGYAAGMSPDLQLTHMVPHREANRKYLQRLAWRNGLHRETGMLEIFPERRTQLLRRLLPAEKFSRQALKRMLSTTWHRDPMKRFDLARFLGNHAGIYAALRQPLPSMVERIIQFLRLNQA